MRIDIHFDNRPGFARAALGVLVIHKYELRALERVPHHLYVDLPDESEDDLPGLTVALREIPGFAGLRRVAALPRELRLRQLEAVVEAFPDPVIAINRQGLVVLANSAAKEAWGAWLAGLPIDEIIGRKGWSKDDWQPKPGDDAEFLGGEIQFADKRYLVERIPIPAQGSDGGIAGAVLVLRPPQRVAALHGFLAEAMHAGKGVEAEAPHPPKADGAPESWAVAQKRFEAELLRQLYPAYPSSRKLAKRLKLSHTAIANKLRAHGIGPER